MLHTPVSLFLTRSYARLRDRMKNLSKELLRCPNRSVRQWARVDAVQVPACFILLCNRSLLQEYGLELWVPDKVTFPLVHGSFATSDCLLILHTPA
jgi:hypothetical protein